MERQKTIKKPFSLKGKGLQTGKSVKALFSPAEENEGIIFARKGLGKNSRARLSEILNLDSDRRSKIDFGRGHYVETVEHVLSALWGAEIDNIMIELDSPELPAMDGSAAEFLRAFDETGIREQGAERKFLEVKEPLWAEDENSFLGIFPGNAFKVSYILEQAGRAIGKQLFSKNVDARVFREEIAPARTFCMKEEAEALLKQGYGKGADLKNTLVMDDGAPIGTTLRFPDEPVRHKVLDLLGDLYLLGRPLKGRLIAVRSGHKLNLELVKKIKDTII